MKCNSLINIHSTLAVLTYITCEHTAMCHLKMGHCSRTYIYSPCSCEMCVVRKCIIGSPLCQFVDTMLFTPALEGTVSCTPAHMAYRKNNFWTAVLQKCYLEQCRETNLKAGTMPLWHRKFSAQL